MPKQDHAGDASVAPKEVEVELSQEDRNNFLRIAEAAQRRQAAELRTDRPSAPSPQTKAPM
ncbi:hypothetical protein [Chromobacterium sp. CV08]|uniref:hypothetical protein n=1 Tax=Chromobacterium sp. CV08 TaxID=3133274 RepID=UPI003DA9321A